MKRLIDCGKVIGSFRGKPLRLITHAECPRPEYAEQFDVATMEAFGPHVYHGDALYPWTDTLFSNGLDENITYLIAESDSDPLGKIVAHSESMPFYWATPEDDMSLPDTGLDAVFLSGFKSNQENTPVNALCASGIVIYSGFKGENIDLANILLQNMINVAKQRNYAAFVLPLRPTRKADYPLFSFEKYINLTVEVEGKTLPFDPWMRKHIRNGGRMIKPCMESTKCTASIDKWEEWTGLKFPVSGDYHIKGGLAPVRINRKEGKGVYIEPNLWFRYDLDK